MAKNEVGKDRKQTQVKLNRKRTKQETKQFLRRDEDDVAYVRNRATANSSALHAFYNILFKFRNYPALDAKEKKVIYTALAL